MGKTDWEAYDRIVAEQEAETERRLNSPEGKAARAEQKRRADFVHDYIGQVDDHARGYYLGLTRMFAYAGQFAKSDVYSIDIDPRDFAYGYSALGAQQRATHFYSPEPKAAPDLVTHLFDPVLFLSVASELDEGMQLMAWNFELYGYKYAGNIVSHGLKITAACTESDTGVPEDFDWWYAWEPRTAELRDKIAGIGDW